MALQQREVGFVSADASRVEFLAGCSSRADRRAWRA
jgi:hypothetical protein